MIYYRPSDSVEPYQKMDVSRNGGNNPYSGTVDGLYSGNEYEFVLCVGGLKVVRTLTLTGTSELLLESVEEDTDFTGPYDIIRTYKINTDGGNVQSVGNYYLHLEYMQAGSSEYKSLGYVKLNTENNYQEIISSAALGDIWLHPDTDYILKWVLSSSLTPDNSNTEAVLYEKIHTAKANVTLTKGESYFNSQSYMVALDEDDTANLRANERNITIYGYLRVEGSIDYLAEPIECKLTYVDNYTKTFTVANLAPSTSYELFLGTDDRTGEFASASFITAEDNRSITVESVTPAACSAQINYSVNGFNEDSTGYFVYFIRKEGYGGWKYQAYVSVKSALSKDIVTVELYNLEPDSAYEYKIGYGKTNSQEVTSLQETMAEGTFTTRTDNREIRLISAQTKINTADIEYSLSGIDAAEVGRLQLFIREKAGNSVWEYYKQNEYTAPSCSGSFEITGLKDGTDYEYRIGFGGTNGSNISNLRKYVDGEFKTCKDERTIKVKSVTTKSLSAKIDCTLGGMENAQDGYLICYVREVSDGAEDMEEDTVWVNKASEQISLYTTDVSFNITGLKRETSYEYNIGMGSSSGTSVEKFEKSIKGEQPFTTTGDLREIKEVVTPGIFKAAIDCSISGLEETAYLLCYICEDPVTGEENTENEDGEVSKETDTTSSALEWRKIGYRVLKGSEPEHEEAFGIQDLKEHTVYRYRLGFGSSYNTDANALEQCVESTFTTGKDIRELSDEKASVEDAGVVLSARFTGNPEKLPSYIYFFYKADNASVYNKASRVVNASSAESMECSTTLTDLDVSTEYEYAIIISDSDDYRGTPDDIDKSGFKVTGKFTTKAAEIPIKITLSRTQLYLNANAAYAEKQGYGYQIITPVLTPATSTPDVIWESSNPDVAALTNEAGRINAIASGEAVITVSSKYDSAVAAECEVVVGNYQLGYETEDGSIGLLSNNELELRIEKGTQCHGYKLYKIDSDGNPSELSADKFNVHSNNNAVASWDDGIITAKEVGNTKLIFEADDNVPSYLEVYVSAQKGKGFAVVGFTTNNSKYPAKLEDEKDAEGNVQYTLAYTSGITYTAVGESVPSDSGFNNADYIWSIDDETVATVDGSGIVTPHSSGTAILSVTPKSSVDNTGIEVLYAEEQQYRVILHIKDLPAEDLEKATPVYALADITGKIGDVKFPDDEIWEDWQWKYKDTPLIINGVNKESYPFEAVYMGDKYYAQEATVNVYIAKVTGVSAFEDETENISHNNVVEVAGMTADGKPEEGADSVTLTVGISL